MLPYKKKLKLNARNLRRHLTDAEIFLWARIRKKQIRGVQFYRQKPIGNYIVDFYCPAAHLVVEIDGGQHYSEQGLEKDQTCDHYLTQLGLNILRVSAREVFTNTAGVLEAIDQAVAATAPSTCLVSDDRSAD